MKIAVIGGGIFGITTAFTLGEEYDVELFEKNNDLLKAASGSNQYRVHRGYHYPRSIKTVLEIMKSENSFKKIFSDRQLLVIMSIIIALQKKTVLLLLYNLLIFVLNMD